VEASLPHPDHPETSKIMSLRYQYDPNGGVRSLEEFFREAEKCCVTDLATYVQEHIRPGCPLVHAERYVRANATFKH